ncbi:MAG TPA: pitrilysin family protein [Geminicoccaceae bacterium]|nr:pitrilysin family protein [Geminicoccaceae bacterium]
MAEVWRRALVVGSVMLVGALGTAPAGQAASRVQHVVSPGGIEAYLIPEHSIPFLSLALHFKGGSALDPAGKEGLAYMVSGLLDEGAGELDSQAFRTELEDRAIRLSFEAGRDAFTGQLKTLTEHRERAFELLRMALNEPRFDAEPVERIRHQIQAELRRRAEDPDQVVTLTWFETAFPKHPYGKPVEGTAESVANITATDLRRFIGARLAKDNLVVGVAGDVTPEQLGVLLDRAFGDLPATSAAIDLPEAVPAAAGTIVVRRDVPQSRVMFGQAGLPRADPDFYAAYVANHILGGGGFGSRLTEEVREKRGLAYSVYSHLYPMDHGPLWIGGVGTANAAVGESIRLVQAEVARMAEGDVDAATLADAKTYITGSFPLRLTSNDQIASMLVSMQVDDLGIDYLERRNDYIEAVTLADVRRVAQRLYHPDELLTVVVGAPTGLEG